jgi:NAD(P)H-hydrate repair Nnr-like enzyme with NAD(P)H-hydrate epimerase domain
VVCDDDPLEACPGELCEDVQAAVARVLARSRSDDTLIRKAAAGLAVSCADVMRERSGGVNGRRVVLLVGTGNNGADPLLAAVHLLSRGAKVDALLVGGDGYRPGVDALRACHGSAIDARSDTGRAAALSLLAAADLVVDGVVGGRGAGGLRSPADETGRRDTGRGPDRGGRRAERCRPRYRPDIRGACPDVTVTFGSLKPFLLLPPAAHVAGRLVFVDVGLTGELPADRWCGA